MSLFVNLSKTFAGYLTKNLVPIAGSGTGTEAAELTSGFTRWRSTYERFCRRKSKQNLLTPWRAPSNTNCRQSSSALDVRKRRSSLRLRCDKKGLNTVSVLSNMRFSRLFSMSSAQRTHGGLPKNKGSASTSTTAAVLTQHQSVRTKCGRENCADPCLWPMCPPGNKRWPTGENKLHNIYEAYWDDKNEACCENECKWALRHPRFDDIYLQESDKAARRYMRTWNECPPRIKPKRICCYDGEPPEICFRPKQERPQTACPPESCGFDKKCQKLQLPCCCKVREPPTCKRLRSLIKCKKYCTPYPSFSECCKPKGKDKRGQECLCLNPIPMCEYWVYWRKRILSRKGEKC